MGSCIQISLGSSKIAWADTGISTDWSGVITNNEVLDVFAKLHGCTKYDGFRYALYDFSTCTGVEIVPEGMALIAAMDQAGSRTNPRIRTGFVTDREDVKVFLAAYLDSGICPDENRRFRLCEEACKWLGRPMKL